MTNKKNRGQKSPENTPKRKTARDGKPTQGIKQQIPDELVLLADKAQDRIDKNFGEFMRKQGKANIEVVKKLYPIIRDATHMSKLLNGSLHVNLGILVALHHVYGVDLNEFIAGDKSERPSLTPKQVEELRAIVSLYDNFSENPSSQK